MADDKTNQTTDTENGPKATVTGGDGSVATPDMFETEQGNLLDQLRADLDAAKDRVLRSQAELENYRKRAAREIEENQRYANMPLIRDLLPVVDNIERAISAAEKTQDVGALLEGVKLVHKQLEDALARHHCLRIPALHQPFDPHLHHAILQQPTEEFPPNTVVMVTQPGFQLYDRVVRPTQVIVSTAKEKEPAD
jgi:molecular chaperone GrpE